MPKASPTNARAPRKGALPSLMIVDDHPLWRDTLRKTFETSRVGRVVAEASDGGEAVERAAEASPDLIVMDMALPTMDGAAATRSILARRPDTKVLVLSSSEDRADVLRAVKAGAAGYLLKSAGAKEIVEAIRRIRSGEMVFPPSLAEVVLAELRRPGEGAPPGIRVALVVAGMLDREGLAKLLRGTDIDVVSAGGSPDGLIDDAALDPPDVVIAADPSDGARLREALPRCGLLVLAERIEPSEALALLGAGSRGMGYMLRSRVADLEQLTDAIRRVAAGESALDPDVLTALAGGERTPSSVAVLTDREREVLVEIAEGRSNAAICKRLFLSAKTLERHIGSIFMKLGLEETADDHRRVLAVLKYLKSSG